MTVARRRRPRGAERPRRRRPLRRRAADGRRGAPVRERARDAGGTLHWDVLRLYQDTLDGLRAAAREATVDSVAVDSWAVDFGLLDKGGRLIRNPVHYRDARRRNSGSRALFARVPPRELYERTGIQMLPINTVFELAAMAEETRSGSRCCGDAAS